MCKSRASRRIGSESLQPDQGVPKSSLSDIVSEHEKDTEDPSIEGGLLTSLLCSDYELLLPKGRGRLQWTPVARGAGVRPGGTCGLAINLSRSDYRDY